MGIVRVAKYITAISTWFWDGMDVEWVTANGQTSAVLVRNAVTTGVDTRLRFGNRNYEAAGNVGLTFLDGEPNAIERVQRASTQLPCASCSTRTGCVPPTCAPNRNA